MQPFSSVIPKIAGECPICLEEINVGDVDIVAHGGIEGPKHPLHRQCAIDTMEKVRHKCPNCDCSVNRDSLFPLKERVVRELTHMKAAAYTGAKHGLLIAVPTGALAATVLPLPLVVAAVGLMVFNSTAGPVASGFLYRRGITTFFQNPSLHESE